jgi:N-acetylmuramoyl-L-alanine amidase
MPLSRLFAALVTLVVVLGTFRATPLAAQQEPVPATPTPDPALFPTPTPRPAGTTPRVGIQVGHWKSGELPDELARLRGSTGTFVRGLSEVEVNLDVARRVEALLVAQGVAVDLLPATVPPGYDADAFVAIHADGATKPGARGFKIATPWRTSRAAQHLRDALDAEYVAATRLPRDGAITFNMRGYYAFSFRRHTHAVARTTPAVILEMGFLTSPADRAFMTGRADVVARGIAEGVLRYLRERDPSDGAALLPPDFKPHRPAADGVVVRAAPNERARILQRLGPDSRMTIFEERDGWYQGFVRGEWRTMGWVRAADLVVTDDPLPTPLPATDS